MTKQQIGLIKWANRYSLAEVIYGSGMTSHEVARKTGLNHSTMMRIVRGKTIPSIEQAGAIQAIVIGWIPLAVKDKNQAKIGA